MVLTPYGGYSRHPPHSFLHFVQRGVGVVGARGLAGDLALPRVHETAASPHTNHKHHTRRGNLTG